MRRKALLIGDSGSKDSYLSGVEYDLSNYANFLKSLRGGAWYDSEISIISNESKDTILQEIMDIKQDRYDIVFAVFTGHGWYDDYKQCRMLSIDDEEITEKKLWNLAPKQILILDSCSCLPNITQESAKLKSLLLELQNLLARLARQKYENFCSQCPTQQIYLYVSKIGTFANDTEKGGLYSTHLLKILIKNTIKGNYLDIVSAHKNVVDKFRQTKEQQEPAIKIQGDNNKLYLPVAIQDF